MRTTSANKEYQGKETMQNVSERLEDMRNNNDAIEISPYDDDAIEISAYDDQDIKAEEQRRSLFGRLIYVISALIGILYIALLVWLYCSKSLDWHVFSIGVTALVVPPTTLSIVLIKSLSKSKSTSKESDIAVSIGLKAILDAIKEIASIFKK